MRRRTKKQHWGVGMRSIEKGIIILAVVVFITAVGAGIFDIYFNYFGRGIDVFIALGRQSTELIAAAVALVTVVVTLRNATRGRKKRK